MLILELNSVCLHQVCPSKVWCEYSFNDDKNTYISHSNETCDLYERDKRACHSVGGPASLTTLYCTGM